MAGRMRYNTTFNERQNISRFEQVLIIRILNEIVDMGGEITALMETEYNQFQVIHGIHTSNGETHEHFTIRLFNDYSIGVGSLRRTARVASGLYHINLDSAFDITSITVVRNIRLRPTDP